MKGHYFVVCGEYLFECKMFGILKCTCRTAEEREACGSWVAFDLAMEGHKECVHGGVTWN